MESKQTQPSSKWETTKTDAGLLIQAEFPGMKVSQFEIIQKKIAPPKADQKLLNEIDDYNTRFSDIPKTRSTEVVFDDKEAMISCVASYALFISTRNEVELQRAALDKTYLINGNPLGEKYRDEISMKLSEIKNNLTNSIEKSIDSGETWYSVIEGDGGDIIMCSKEKNGKYKMILTGLKNDEDYTEPDLPVLSACSIIWLRDADLLAPSSITLGQMQRVFTSPDSFFGGRSTDATIQHEEFVVNGGKSLLKVLKPLDENLVINN